MAEKVEDIFKRTVETHSPCQRFYQNRSNTARDCLDKAVHYFGLLLINT